MRITLGLRLDGETPPFPENTAGSVRTGPNGLLQILETRLGLGGIIVDNAIRIAQYRAALIQTDHNRRFFTRSLAVDAMAVAKTLLSWRDLWLMAGWQPGSSRPSSIKIHDLFEIEAIAQKMLSAGEPERWRAVLDTLARRKSQIEAIQCIDPIGNFPGLIQKVLQQLNASYSAQPFLLKAIAKPESDLWKIQSALLAGNPRCAPLNNDGSVLILTGTSDRTLAYGVGNYLKSKSWPGTTILLSSTGTAALDDGLHSLGMPRTSAGITTPYRPASQLTRLCLSIFWQPCNPYRMLELLTHPVSPIPRYISSQLAQAVAKSPGIDGQEWLKAIENLTQWVEIRREAGKSVYDINALIQTWLVPPSFSPISGGPINTFVNHCDEIISWSGKMARLADNSAAARQNYQIVYHDAIATKRILTEYIATGKTTINAIELEQILDETNGSSAGRLDRFPELGHVPVVKSPESLTDQTQTVVWWDFLRPTMPNLWPTLQPLLPELQEQGASIPSSKDILSRQSESWLRPVMAATDRLVLCIPERINGTEVFPHPLYDNLAAMTVATPLIRHVCDSFLKGQQAAPWDTAIVSIKHKPLPPLQRWWNISAAHLLLPRASESYSSIDAFLKSPYKWVLQYKARLVPLSILAISEGDTLKGKLSHRVLECLFASSEIDWKITDDTQLKTWTNLRLTQLMSEEGAHLLLPGLRREVEGLRLSIFAAASTLLRHLRDAKVEMVTMELPIQKAKFKGMELSGFIDLLAVNSAGGEAVVDLKWGGRTYRSGLLKDNQQIQLAIYSASRLQSVQKWPSDGFFIIRAKSMLAQSNTFFPGANVIRQNQDVSSIDLWQAVEKCWDWRRAQLDNGQIEITVTGTTLDKNSNNPVAGITIPEADDRYNDYRTLTGWGNVK